MIVNVKRKLARPEPKKVEAYLTTRVKGQGVASAGPFDQRGVYFSQKSSIAKNQTAFHLVDNGFNLTQMNTVTSNVTTRVSNTKTPISILGVLDTALNRQNLATLSERPKKFPPNQVYQKNTMYNGFFQGSLHENVMTPEKVKSIELSKKFEDSSVMVSDTNRSLETYRQGINWVKTQSIFENRMSKIKNLKIVPQQRDKNIYLRANRLD
jgi:hypothetical protein